MRLSSIAITYEKSSRVRLSCTFLHVSRLNPKDSCLTLKLSEEPFFVWVLKICEQAFTARTEFKRIFILRKLEA